MPVTNTSIPCIISNNPGGYSDNAKQCLEFPNAKITYNKKKRAIFTFLEFMYIVLKSAIMFYFINH